MAVIENDVIKVTVSNSSSKNVIRVSPGVAALSSVSISLNELNNVDTSGITNGQTIVYNNGSFVAGDSGAVESINGEFPDAEGDVAIDFSVDGLSDVTAPSPSEGDILKYESNRWVNDSLGKADVGLNNVDNTSDSDKPVSTATQTALDAKANTSAVPVSLNDLSDVSIIGTPAKNTALLYDETANAFKFQPSFTNRFEDEAENNKQAILPFVERVYTVKTDGDGIFIDSQSDTPTAGKVIKRKIYHKVGFIASGDLIGDYTLVHTFADDIAYSATESVFEGFRDGDTYGTAPFTLIQTWEEVTAAPAFTGLLNETYGSGAEAAYSTRRLNGNVTDCMVIRRASDSTTTTIGFDGSGNISEADIISFCTGTTCTVYQWLDQSGNGNTATAASTGEEPTIYTGGALVKEQGRVALQGTSTSKLPLTSTVTLSNEASIFTLCTTKATDNPWGGDSSGTGQLTWVYFSSVNTNWRLITDSGLANYTVPFTVEGTRLLQTHNRNSSNSVPLTLNGTLANTKSLSGDIPVSVVMGGNWFNYAGIGQEMIFYNSEKSASDQTSIEENVGDYFTQNTPLLDTYTGAAAAYSLRRLSSSYVGSAVEVYNGSSYADIGFNVFGELDTVALAAHCGSNDGFVSKWYSQTGSNHATQTTTSYMPKIYDGTTGVETQDGKPAINYSSVGTDTLTMTNVLEVVTSVHVLKGETGTGFEQYVLGALTGLDWYSNTGQFVYSASSAGSNTALHLNGVSQNPYISRPTTQSLAFFNWNTGTSGTTQTISADRSSGGSNRSWKGTIQELIMYTSDQSTNRTGIETNIATFYDITI